MERWIANEIAAYRNFLFRLSKVLCINRRLGTEHLRLETMLHVLPTSLVVAEC